MNSARKTDSNGFLLVKGCPLSSYGIFDYSARQVGLPGDPNRIVKVYRPESAVSDPEAIESFKNVPFINEHEMLHGTDEHEGSAPEEKGIEGILTSNVYYEAPWMRGDIKVFSRSLQQSLKSKKDLSLGYGCQFEHKAGTWNGQPYEVIQTRLRGNHIALVDEGRVPGARVLDGLVFDHLSFEPVIKPSEELPMSKVNGKAADNAVEQLKALIPALQQFLNEEATEPAHQDGGGEETEVATPDVAMEPEDGTEQPDVSNAEEAPAVAEQPAEEPADAPEQEGGDNLAQLIDQVKSVLAQLESVASGGQSADEELSDEPAADTVEGLQESSHPGAQVCADEDDINHNPKASPGPTEGTHSSAQDAAIRNFYRDAAIKNRIYDRLSPIVGAFDHSAMDSRQVIDYGVKKLNIKCADSSKADALESYLSAREAVLQQEREKLTKKHVGDSAVKVPAIEAYLKGDA